MREAYGFTGLRRRLAYFVVLHAGGGDNSLRLWNTSGALGGESSELQLLKSFHTKATPVFCTQFTPRNLLLGSGALTLSRKQK